MRRFRALSLSFTLIAACQSATHAPELEPLGVVESLPVEYESRVAYAGGLAALEEPWDGSEPALPGGATFDVLVDLVSLPAAAAERLIAGNATGLGGWRVGRAAAEAQLAALVESGTAESVSDSRLGIFADRTSYVAVSNQIAFISAFEVEKSAAVLIADPVVDVLQDGIVARVRVSPVAESALLELDVTLAMTDVEHPIQNAEVRIPGSKTPVTLQLPIACRQELRSSFVLASDECAVLSGLATTDPERRLLAFVRAQPLTHGTAPAQRSTAP